MMSDLTKQIKKVFSNEQPEWKSKQRIPNVVDFDYLVHIDVYIRCRGGKFLLRLLPYKFGLQIRK